MLVENKALLMALNNLNVEIILIQWSLYNYLSLLYCHKICGLHDSPIVNELEFAFLCSRILSFFPTLPA